MKRQRIAKSSVFLLFQRTLIQNGGVKRMCFKTINPAAKEVGIPPFTLRSMVKRGACPGFYSGNRFLVNVDLLREQLERESRAAVTNVQ